MRRTRLKRVSDKRRVALGDYFILKGKFLSAYPLCQFPDCVFRARHVHHKAGSVGKKLNDVRYWMAVCQMHHEWIHSHAKEARKLGYILWK